jgi:hypothetical protein
LRLEAVAHPSNGLDQAFAELLPQVSDVDVDDVGTWVAVVSADKAEELLP